MKDINEIVNIEKIKECKEQERNQRVVNARKSICREIGRYICSLEDGILDTYSRMETQQDKEYLKAQLDVLAIINSFINERFLK